MSLLSVRIGREGWTPRLKPDDRFESILPNPMIAKAAIIEGQAIDITFNGRDEPDFEIQVSARLSSGAIASIWIQYVSPFTANNPMPETL